MTKADLKTGMFGVMSNGKRFVIVNDKLVYQEGGYDFIRSFDNDLCIEGHFEILFLVNAVSFRNLDEILRCRKEDDTFIIFDRTKKSETVMTIAEIEEKLGIKNLRIKGE